MDVLRLTEESRETLVWLKLLSSLLCILVIGVIKVAQRAQLRIPPVSYSSET
jgi:hypothetical protein